MRSWDEPTQVVDRPVTNHVGTTSSATHFSPPPRDTGTVTDLVGAGNKEKVESYVPKVGVFHFGNNVGDPAGVFESKDKGTCISPIPLSSQLHGNEATKFVGDLERDEQEIHVGFPSVNKESRETLMEVVIESNIDSRSGPLSSGPPTVSVPKKQPTWKKRARVQHQSRSSGPTENPLALRGKRKLMGDEVLEVDGVSRMKKSRNAGGVAIHESLSVAADD